MKYWKFNVIYYAYCFCTIVILKKNHKWSHCKLGSVYSVLENRMLEWIGQFQEYQSVGPCPSITEQQRRSMWIPQRLDVFSCVLNARYIVGNSKKCFINWMSFLRKFQRTERLSLTDKSLFKLLHFYQSSNSFNL